MTDTDRLDYLSDFVAGVRFPNDGSVEVFLLDGQVATAPTLREAIEMAVLIDQNYVYPRDVRGAGGGRGSTWTWE